jgi:hypothetical protein
MRVFFLPFHLILIFRWANMGELATREGQAGEIKFWPGIALVPCRAL